MIHMCSDGCNGEHRHGSCHYSGGGLIQMLVLRILHEKPAHGYQIMDELRKITAEKYIPEPGAIYTMLRRMEDRGAVTSEWEKKESGADRRVYTITEKGIKVLKEGLEMVKRRRELMDSLVQYYEANFAEKEERGA
jgi:PadR family transcriptional regulator, regulatory protein PadR